MPLHKTDRFSFRWSKSELPDSDDINRQVLLLGITRFETTPSPVPSLKLLATASSVRERLKRDKDSNDTNAIAKSHKDNASIISSRAGIYESHEHLTKFTGCFALDKKSKAKKITNYPNIQTESTPSNTIDASLKSHDQKSFAYHQHRYRRHQNHFDRLIERFQSKETHRPNLGVNDDSNSATTTTTPPHRNTIEQKTFYRWLTLSRTKRLERNAKCLNDADQWQSSVRRSSTPVTRKCSTKSNSTRRKATKIRQKRSAAVAAAAAAKSTSSSSSRFTSCIPLYCVSAAKSRTNSIADNSLASSHHQHNDTENYRKRRGTSVVNNNSGGGGSSGSIDHRRNRLNSSSNDLLKHFHCKLNQNLDGPTGSNYADTNNKNKHKNYNSNNRNNNNNNNCSQFSNLNTMDRSVDSIGSCSLDVDAESTDFSDTSGSLNVCTPLSGKDFTREFTSRIHERCQFPVHQSNNQKLQQTKTILDPNSGKISTILSQNVPSAAAVAAATAAAAAAAAATTTTTTTINSPTSPAKKPSYLSLACCVNGYSNLTTYDSKFRQSINKSREVSPIRPITYSIQYNRNGDNNLLSVPIAVPINDNSKHHMMDTHHAILSPEKRFYSTQTQQKTIELNGTNHDVTDNVNSNGCAKFFARSMLHTTATNGTSPNTSLALVRDVNQEFDTNGKGASKSFIQQRVERLYGPGAVTQGLYSPKKPKSADDNNQEQQTITQRTALSSVLVEKSQNSSNTTTTFQSTKYVLEAQRNGHLNGLSHSRSNGSDTGVGNGGGGGGISGAHDDDENINLDTLSEALPVLRHLRPEFRAQLPTLSPKRTIAITKLTTSSLSPLQPLSQQASASSTAATAATAAATTTTKTNTDNAATSTLAHTQSAYTNGTSVNGKLNISTSILNSVSHSTPTTTKITDAATVSPKCDELSRSTFDSTQSQINQQNKSVTPVAFHTTTSTSIPTPTPAPTSTSTLTSPSTTTTTSTNNETMDANGNHSTDQTKDAQYYLNTVHAERDRLLNLADAVEKELEELLERGGVDDEVLGNLRSAAGKARLLATKKFKQFEGLCNDCINQITRDMPPPTPADLQGFWEMVYLQVENVDSTFADLETIRANGWKKPTPVKPKQPQGARLTRRPVTAASRGGSTTTSAPTASGTTQKSASAIAAAQKREAQRQQLLELRRKNKMAMANNE